MLIRAAVNAARQWRYKPYSLNGEPVEAETQINVNFKLQGQVILTARLDSAPFARLRLLDQ